MDYQILLCQAECCRIRPAAAKVCLRVLTNKKAGSFDGGNAWAVNPLSSDIPGDGSLRMATMCFT